MTENNCTKSGCPAKCCSNIVTIMTPGQFNSFADCTATAIRINGPPVPIYKAPILNPHLHPDGVYPKRVITDDGRRMVRVQIIGPCPVLDEKDNCLVERNKPAGCRNFEVGLKPCLKRKLKN